MSDGDISRTSFQLPTQYCSKELGFLFVFIRGLVFQKMQAT